MRRSGALQPAHIAALASLSPHLTELKLRGKLSHDLGSATAAALAAALPSLQQLHLRCTDNTLLPPAYLVQLAADLPTLRCLHLAAGMRISSPSDTALAALTMQKRAQAQQRPQRLMIKLGEGRDGRWCREVPLL